MGTLADFSAVMDLVFAGKLHAVLDRSYALSEAHLAQARLEAGLQLGKITLDIPG
jgi:NADPH:quinone reductase-like Zn-dependent oxidoreductase